MNRTEPPLSIAALVTTYNRRDRLPRLLDSLAEDPVLDEVVVVVDGSPDGSFALLEELAAGEPRLRPVFIPNSGQFEAQLAGAAHAGSDLLVLLDDDVVPTTGLFAGHARHHEAESGLVVIGYLSMPPEAWRPGAFTREFYRDAYERHCAAWERDPSLILSTLWAGNMSIRRSDLLRVRELGPPIVRGYHADKDLGLRCLRLGLRGLFDRSLVVHHEYERTLEGFGADARSSGRNWDAVVNAHRDLLGDAPADESRSVPLRLLLRICRIHDRVGAAAARWLRALARVGGTARSPTVEFAAGKLLRQVERQRGTMEAEGNPPRPR